MNLLSCIDLYLIEKVYPDFFSLFVVFKKVDWNSTMKMEFQSNIFDDVLNKLVSAHCTVTSTVLTVTDENHKRCIFPIPQLMFRGLTCSICFIWSSMDSFSFALSGVRTYSIVVELAVSRRLLRSMAAWAGSVSRQTTVPGYTNKLGSLEWLRNVLPCNCSVIFIMWFSVCFRPTWDLFTYLEASFHIGNLIYVSMIKCEYWMVYVILLIP